MSGLLLLLNSFLLLALLINPPPLVLSTWEASTPQGMVVKEEKIRLGSTPPSCHNRCNECNPCIAIQVPTLPGSGRHDEVVVGPTSFSEQSYGGYSNYKPLGWKCRCRDRLFNP